MTEPARPLELPAPPAAEPTAVGSFGPALLSAMRPRQWTKNLLVLAAPIAGGDLNQRTSLVGGALAFLAFTAASAGCYLVNDVSDAARDRLHPMKRHRAIAAGRVSPVAALLAAALLDSVAVALPLAAGLRGLALIIVSYLLLTLSYARWLKHVPGVELLVIAAGFTLRPLAGALGTGVPPSSWFLLVCASGSLTIAFGKRCAELRRLGVHAVRSRPVLARYGVGGLVIGRGLAGGGAVLAYLGWASTREGRVATGAALMSAALFAAALLRYRSCNERGLGEAPEDLLLTDRPMQWIGGSWFLVFLVGVFGG